jgi:predicted Zn-dependent peptidase
MPVWEWPVIRGINKKVTDKRLPWLGGQGWRQFWHRVIILVMSLSFWGMLCPSMALAQPTPTRTTLPTNPTPLTIQPYLERVKSKVSEFTLSNGMKFIVLERHQAPVVSFLTYADVGGADEPVGQTGVAHYLEHLAFKGTRRIGTRDYTAEAPLLNRLDQLFDQIQAARKAGQAQQVQSLQTEFQRLEAEAKRYVIQNQYGQIVSQSGGVGLNANTSADATRYFYSFPSNKLELWMSLESERFLEPVFREFFKEKDVILEERRMRNDNSPVGQMVEAFLQKAFTTHPYRRPVIGSSQDIGNLTRKNVEDFFATYYVPNNLTMAVVGDINPVEVKRLAEIYFGRYPAGRKPPQVTLVEPAQTAPRELTLRLPTQPWYMEGYHIPSIRDPDYVVAEMINGILSSGRTSRLYQSLVVKQRLALSAQGFSGMPGNKHANLMLFYALTAPNQTVEKVATALRTEIERLKTEPVTAAELERIKKSARMGLLQSLDSNQGMAQLLLDYQVKTGNWRNLFQRLEAIDAVTPADVQRFANKTFVANNRTVGKLLPQA